MRQIVLAALLLAACSTTADEAGFGLADVPLAAFPSDEYTVADARTRTGLRVALPQDVMADPLFRGFPDLVTETESLDGFGTSAPLWLRFEGPIDVATLPDLAGSTSERASVQLIEIESGERVAFETHYDGPSHTLFVMPYGALKPKTRHALVVTEALRDYLGRPLEGEAAIDVAGAVLSVSFTTQSTVDTLAELALRDVAHDASEHPSPISECAGSPHVAWVGKGKLRSPDYRTADDRFPTQLDDDTSAPEPFDARIPYIVVFPKNVTNAPTVLVQHGLSGSKEGVLICNMGERYAARGYATIAIDGAWHGERGPNGEEPNFLSYFRVIFGLWTDGERLTTRLRYGRDALRQTALDHVQLAALVKQMASAHDLSGEVFYNGESMGGIIGSMTTAIAPNIPASVLNVPGGRLSNLVLLSELNLYELVAGPILDAAGGELGAGDLRRFLALFQTIAERGDPINYAPLWHLAPAKGRAKKSVVVQETPEDVLVPNRTTEDLARAGGLKHLTPALQEAPNMETELIPAAGLANNLGDGLAGGMVQIKTVTRGGAQEEASHGTMGTPEALGQAADFYDGWLQGAPTITRVY